MEYHYKGVWKSNELDEEMAERVILKPIKDFGLLKHLSLYIENSRKKLIKNILEVENYEFLIRKHIRYLYIEFKDKYKEVLDNLDRYVHY